MSTLAFEATLIFKIPSKTRKASWAKPTASPVHSIKICSIHHQEGRMVMSTLAGMATPQQDGDFDTKPLRASETNEILSLLVTYSYSLGQVRVGYDSWL